MFVFASFHRFSETNLIFFESPPTRRIISLYGLLGNYTYLQGTGTVTLARITYFRNTRQVNKGVMTWFYP